MSVTEIIIENNMNVENLLFRLNNIDKGYNYYGDNKILVNFSRCNFVSPSILVILLSYLKQKEYDSNNIIFDICDGNCLSYVQRMDFYKLLGIDNDENFFRHNENARFITIKNFENDKYYDLLDEIVNILKKNCSLSREMEYVIDFSFNELLDNIIEHAKSNIGGFFVAQKFPNKQRIEICIVDNGIGIPNSLKQNNKYKSYNDIDCLKESINKNVSSGNGQGNGLYFTRKFIENYYGNEMYLYTHGQILKISNSQICISTNNELYWKGTIMKLVINYTHHIDVYNFFEEYGKSIELPDDKNNIDYISELW